MKQNINEFEAMSFDCYGTMIDWESGIWDALQPVIMHNKRSDITRATALEEFAITETAQEKATPDMDYAALLTKVHATMSERLELRSNSELDKRFGGSVPYWPAFPDSADALRILKKHYKLVILSNVNRSGFAASNQKLGVEFDAVYTAEDIGSYKPNTRNFDYLLQHVKDDLGVNAVNLLHTAQSLHHDHVPATKAGLQKAWIDRQDLAHTEHWGATAVVENRPQIDFRFTSLMEMALAVQASG